MSMIWTKNGVYRQVEYEKETDLEAAILEVQKSLFGKDRIYLDVKKKIGIKGSIQNIPDGYLLDFCGHKPRLYVVENELGNHDPLRHIAVQILQFSLSFEESPHKVKTILAETLRGQMEAYSKCAAYTEKHGYDSVDHLLEYVVHEAPFAALVIIDEASEALETVLATKFKFPVEVLTLTVFENQSGDRLYYFDPFLEGVVEDVEFEKPSDPRRPAVDIDEIDTIVVPARQEGFERVFIGEDCWHAVRIHALMRPQIKYIAAYQVAPISAITHIALVRSVEAWKDTGKCVVNFAEKAHEIGPIPLVKGGRILPLYGLRYAKKAKLDAAKTMDDVW